MDEKELRTLNTILSMAAKNPEFRNKLFMEPLTTLEGFEISDYTKDIIVDTINGILDSL